MKLFWQALLKFLCGVVIVSVLLFLPAGTFNYWNAWLLMGILFVPMFFAGIVMMIKNPALLKKRLSAKEEQTEQKSVIAFSGLMFMLGFIIAGLSYRFGWLIFPSWVSWVGAGLFLVSYLLYAEVLRENTYLSRTIEVQQGQQVIDTELIWHRSPSDVQRYYHPIPIYAFGVGVFALLRHFPCIPRHHREATQK